MNLEQLCTMNLRTLLLGPALALGLAALAQPAPPYAIYIVGSLEDCLWYSQITITTLPGTEPALSYTFDLVNCSFDTLLYMDSPGGGFTFTATCNGATESAVGQYQIDFLGNDSLFVGLSCSGGTADCLGVVNGTDLPGAPCDDTDPNTSGDVWNANCQCEGQGSNDILFVTGSVSGCNGASPVHITDWWTVPILDTIIYTDANCEYSFSYAPTNSVQGWVIVEPSCNGGLSWMWDSTYYSFNGTGSVTLNFNCGSMAEDCTGIPGGPNVPGASCSDNNPNTINDTWNANCTCVGTSLPPSCTAAFGIWEQAPWVMGTANASNGMSPIQFNWVLPDGSTSIESSPSFTFSASGTYGICLTITTADLCTSTTCDTVYVDANGTITEPPYYYDCLGIPNGPHLQGAPCQVPGTTVMGAWNTNCECEPNGTLLFDCLYYLNGPNMPGTACTTLLDSVLYIGYWSVDCVCSVDTTLVSYDCLGILNGPNVPGAPCDDGDPNTENDSWSPGCLCDGLPIQVCDANFFVMQAYQWVDSIADPNGGGGEPIPNELWLWNLSNGGTGSYSYVWNWGDGSTSTEVYPSHTYAGAGTYTICLTINDNAGCTDTFCHDITVDGDGLLGGFVGGSNRSTVTINVMNPLTTGMTETRTLANFTAWPNPVNDVLNLTLESSLKGNLRIGITDMSGRVVYSGTRTVNGGRANLSIPVTELNAGMYLISISNGTTALSERFVKVL